MSNAHRYGTKRYFITEAANANESWRDLYSRLRDKVHAQELPWVFMANNPVKGQPRIPKSMAEQLVDLKNEIRRVYAAVGRDITGMTDEDSPTPTPEPKTPEVTPTPRAKKKVSLEDEKRFFFNEWKRLRGWIKDRAASTGGSEIDSLETMRPVNEARRGIDNGISAKAMLAAMTLHWSDDSKRSAGIDKVDFTSLSDPVAKGMHRLSGYVVKLIESNIPVMLVGAAGTGKSTVIRQCADHLGVPYGETPLTAGATPSWLLGRQTFPSGEEIRFDIPEGASVEEMMRILIETMAQLKSQTTYQISHFLEIYSGGGIFNFEEIDAADPNMLLVVNNALAANPDKGEGFFNPVNGEFYPRSPDFRATATANTFGLGANASYTGRERLDLATIDRFRMGRVLTHLDEELAERLMFQ